MKAHLSIATISLLAAGTLHAQEPTPGVNRTSAPPPRPHAVAAPAVAAPAPRPQTFTPATSSSRSTPFGSGAYRPLPNYTSRQFQPTVARRGPSTAYGAIPASRNWNAVPRTGTAGVAPRVGTVPQQNTTGTSGSRNWNSGTHTWNSGQRNWTSGSRNWNRPGSNTNVVSGTSTGTNTTANDWRTRNRNNYASWQDARRRYDHHRHDRDWWRRHHDRIVFVNNGYYFWDAGWWYPAWGYDPAYDSYAYDGPIYGYDGLPPDQVIARVQSVLQQQGYYYGAIDGELGPMTQQALAAWQRDHGLAITTAIDYPTLASLGMT